MDQDTAFSPPIVLELLDGSRARFARADLDEWNAIAEEIHAPLRRAALDAAEKLKGADRVEAVMAAMASFTSVETAQDRCLKDGVWRKRFLVRAAMALGETEESAKQKLKLIPSHYLGELVWILAMLPVVKNVKVGTAENPYRPGVDHAASEQADSIGVESSALQDESSTSIPASAPTATSTSSSR